ncbi:MAG: hypothetical protein IJV99_03510 [Clostridia bacterium]|nr:hypothetical protein [Clostridia bacterium]
MEKDLGLIELFELYQGLLTERQRELFSCYYLYDLSLSEISEPEGKTRQNVYESLKKVKEKLKGYEEVLRLKEKNLELKKVAEKLSTLDETSSKKILEIIGK